MDIRSLVPDLLNLNNELQTMGLTPVLRVVTQSSYDDTQLGTKLLIDTLPLSLRSKIDHTNVRRDYTTALAIPTLDIPLVSTVSAIASDVKGAIVDSIKSVLKGVDSVDDRSLAGFKIESTIHPGQSYPTLHGIFNVRMGFNPDDITYGSDLIKEGYPIWVYMGYIDSNDNIISHPFDTTMKDNIPLVFGGIIAGITRDKTKAGSRILIQAVGYNWYLSRFTTKKRINTRTTYSIDETFRKLFEGFNASGGDKIPFIMNEVLRIDSTTLLPKIRYIYGAHNDMKPVNTSSHDGRGWMPVMKNNQSFLQGIKNIEHIYEVDIEWEPNGYITVHGRNDPLTRIIKHDEYSDERVHNIIVGGNTINIEDKKDSTGIVSSIDIIIKNHESLPSNIFSLNQDFIRAVIMNEYAEMVGIKDEDAKNILKVNLFNLFPGRKIEIDLTAYASSDVDETEYDFLDTYEVIGVEDSRPPISRKLLAQIIKRNYFWGMKGSAMIAGNPFIREGDLVQVIDISTDESGNFINFDATKHILESLSDKLETIRTSDKEKLKFISDRINPSYGISPFTNIYYIWKVIHYLGTDGFWTKVHYVKQREAPLSSSNIMDLLSSSNRAKSRR